MISKHCFICDQTMNLVNELIQELQFVGYFLKNMEGAVLIWQTYTSQEV